jgi:hypothetical protein
LLLALPLLFPQPLDLPYKHLYRVLGIGLMGHEIKKPAWHDLIPAGNGNARNPGNDVCSPWLRTPAGLQSRHP